MEITELQAETEQIRKRHERYGVTEESKFNLEQIQKAIEFKEKNEGNPEYELSNCFTPLVNDSKRYYQMIKKKRNQKWQEKKNKDKNIEEDKPKKVEWWQKNK